MKEVTIKLPVSVWSFFNKLAKEKAVSFQKAFKEYLGLFEEEGNLSLSKYDKKIFPIAINIWSQIETLEQEVKSIQTTAPNSKKNIYSIILHSLQSSKAVFEVLINKLEKGTGNVLSEKERNRCWDYTLIIEQVHQLILENQNNIPKIEKVLIEGLSLQKLKSPSGGGNHTDELKRRSI